MPTSSALSSSSKHATGEKNLRTLDTPTPVMVWEVPDTTIWEIPEGDAAIMDAETTSGNSGPAGGDADPTLGTKFGLAYREKDAPLNDWTVFAVFTIDPFNQLTISKQQDGRASERRRIEFDDRVIDADTDSLSFEGGEEIALVTNGDDTIDHTALYFNYDMTVYDA